VSTFPTGLEHVAIYLRKSRADLEAEARGEGETLTKHRRALLELAKQYHYSIDHIYEEIVSGELIVDRPEVQRLLHAVREGKYSAVLVMDIDRLGRGNQIDQGIIQQAFKQSGTLIITPRKVYNLEDELDEEFSEFEQFMARRELKIITRRMQRGRKLSAKEGKSITPYVPFGYKRDENLKLYPDPETAPIVRQIFEWSAEGLGIIKIAKKLNEMGVPAPRSCGWQRTTVQHILKNEVYLGRIVWDKKRDVKTTEGKYRSIKRPREEWIVHENAHEPIISQELWDRVVEIRKVNDHRTKDNYDLKNPFAGILRCKQCGRVMKRQPRPNRNGDTLQCYTTGCPTREVLLSRLEDRVLQSIEEFVQSYAAQSSVKKRADNRQKKLEALHRQKKSIQSKLSKLETQKNRLFDFLEQGIYDVQTFIERSKLVGEQIDQAKEELKICEQAIEREMLQQQHEEELIPAISEAIAMYRTASNAEIKNMALKSVIKEIHYYRPRSWSKSKEFEIDIYFRI